MEVYKEAVPLIVLCQERDLGIDGADKQGNWQNEKVLHPKRFEKKRREEGSFVWRRRMTESGFNKQQTAFQARLVNGVIRREKVSHFPSFWALFRIRLVWLAAPLGTPCGDHWRRGQAPDEAQIRTGHGRV